ncbi:MAG: hypothetical protein RMZ43_019335 [Nostoc sp. CmiVER01]|uniref:hypothetical protein n=1 Tax=Nostoc sp. CmiVER01 TaxID=3075384 RepID=UPI002AD540F6|nr:hypothetical protein [Nostoc sp. CmiVER01]MDZ8126677.1 hypothetical protein [Nostoc sp. CmiVER01]
MTKNKAQAQEMEERLKYWLSNFGENITRIDHVIDSLEDLREELNTDNVDLSKIGINDYMYDFIISLKLLKKDLSDDIKTIKSCLD